MTMAVDRAGKDELAARVDLAGAGGKVPAEGRDDAVLHADIAALRVGGGDDRAVADDEIVVRHAGPRAPNSVKRLVAATLAARPAERNSRGAGVAVCVRAAV